MALTHGLSEILDALLEINKNECITSFLQTNLKSF